jgi:hypothetical protein
MLAMIAVTLYFLIFFALATWRPGSVLGAALSMLAMEQWAQANSGFFVAHPQVMNYLFGLLVIWALCVTILKYGNPIGNITVVAMVSFALLALSYASYFWSMDGEMTKFVFEALIPYLGTYIVLFPLVFRQHADLRQGLVASFFVGGAVVTLVFFGTVVGVRSVEFVSSVQDRFGQSFEGGNPLAMGQFGGSMMIIAATIRFRGLAKGWQVLRWVILPISLIVCVQSESRGQLIGALAALLVAVPISLGRFRADRMVAGLFTLVLIGALVPFVLQNFAVTNERWDPANQIREFRETRVDFCARVIENWLFHGSPVNLLLGMGSSSSAQVIGTYPHVVAVEVLVELGLIGAALGVIATALTFFSTVSLVRVTRQNPIERGDIAALIGLFIFNFILSFKQGSFLGSQILIALCIIIAQSDNIWRTMASRMRSMRKRWGMIQKQAAMANAAAAAAMNTPGPTPTAVGS